MLFNGLVDLKNCKSIKYIGKNGKALSHYEKVAFDLLVKAYSKGVFKNKYALIEGYTMADLKRALASKNTTGIFKSLVIEPIVKGEYPIITEDTIEQLTGNDDKDFISEVKKALDTLRALKVIATKNEFKVEIYPVQWNRGIFEEDRAINLYRIDQEFFDNEIEKRGL